MATILVVDDEQDTRDTLSWLLREEGYDVVTASNGHEALVLLRRDPRPCLILLDLLMPGMNGLEFRQHQLEDPRLAAIPTVFLTGALGPSPRLGSSSKYLAKPCEFSSVVEKVRQFCAPTRRLVD